jgi:protein O-GlcNAc transferase
MQHHREGRRQDAERCYREILAFDPTETEASFLLGLLILEGGEPAAAIPWLMRAVEITPGNPAYYAALGEAYCRLRRFPAAFDALLRAVALGPTMVAPPYNLGVLLAGRGAFEGAAACFECAAQIKPDLKDASERLAAVRLRLAAHPKASIHDDALSAAALVALGNSRLSQGQAEAAVVLLRRALALQPRMPAAAATLGSALEDLHRYDEAIEAYERALALGPRQPHLLASLASACFQSGRLHQAIARYREAVALAPRASIVHSDLLYTLQYDPECGARQYLREVLEWDAQHGRSHQGADIAHSNNRTRDRRLRVGYVGADFRKHSSALFLLPLLSNHDRAAFEIFCYSSVRRADEMTLKMRALADGWRDVARMDHAAVARLVRDDKIDVLVDLNMHLGGSRLPVFVRKPAPVQLTWLAYPGTTGVSAIDYRVTDPFLDPPDADGSVYSERLLRLPDTFWCYDPLTSKDAVPSLPDRNGDEITFGCLNNFCKIHEGVISLWSRALNGVKNSRMILRVPLGSARQRTAQSFESHGVSSERIEFVDYYQPRLEYLATYHRIDVCLDTFPVGGHTTNLDAFWMGVPVVTRVGETVIGRGGLSIAMNLGLPELVARTDEEFVQIASELGNAPDRVKQLHSGLPARMEASPLMDAPRFATHLEAAYRRVWSEWSEAPPDTLASA